MAIEVTTVDDGKTQIDNATTYHVDERGFLHIRGTGDGNLASFHANRWQGVVRVDSK